MGDVPTKSTGGEGEKTNSGRDDGRGAPTHSIHGRSRRPQQRYRQMRESHGRGAQTGRGEALTGGTDGGGRRAHQKHRRGGRDDQQRQRRRTRGAHT